MKKVVRQIIEKLKSFKEVEAISLGGSYGCGCADRYSDVDIYVFYKNRFTSESKRKRVLHKIADFELASSGGFIDYFIHKGIDIHTWWEDINDIKKRLRQRPDDFGTRSMVLYTKLVWDRSGKVKALRREIKFPASLARKIVCEDLTLRAVPRTFKENIEKSIIRNRIFFAERSVIFHTQNIIKAIYALNRKYYYNYPQHLQCDFKKFKTVPRNALKNINRIGRYSLIDNPKEKLTALYELYWATVELVRKKYKFEMTHIFPEYGDKGWYRKQIQEISRLIRKTKKRL